MAMAPDPLEGLSAEAREVLDLIVRHHIADGSSLMKQMGLARRDAAVKSIRELEARDLIEVAGPITADELPFSRFGVRPSAKGYLDRMLRYMK